MNRSTSHAAEGKDEIALTPPKEKCPRFATVVEDWLAGQPWPSESLQYHVKLKERRADHANCCRH